MNTSARPVRMDPRVKREGDAKGGFPAPQAASVHSGEEAFMKRRQKVTRA